MESIKELKKKIRKTQREDWFAENISRRFSKYITKLLILIGLNANQVTIFSIIVGIIGGLFFFLPDINIMFIGSLILLLGYVFDYSDGEIARYRNETSILGCYFAKTYHVFVPKFVFAGLTLSTYLLTNKISVIIFGFLILLFSSSFTNMILTETLIQRRNDNFHIKYRPSKQQKKNKKSILNIIFRQFSKLWTEPYTIFILIAVLGFELYNIQNKIINPYTVIYFYIFFYALLFTLLQVSAYILSVKNRTIEKMYAKIFNK